MALRGLEDRRDYLACCGDDAAEVQSLYQDFLIRVTQFFRDPEAFEALKEKVFPAWSQDRPAGTRHPRLGGRLLHRRGGVLAGHLPAGVPRRSPEHVCPIKILATDLNESALEKARAGVYLDNIEIDVSPERLRRFFVRIDGHYQISKSVRELCVFSRHNMATDPPFCRLDLVSCRNVLIYMDAALQKRVLPMLHYALNPDGLPVPGLVREHRPFQRPVRRRWTPGTGSSPQAGAGTACTLDFSSSRRRPRRRSGRRPASDGSAAVERPGRAEGGRPHRS